MRGVLAALLFAGPGVPVALAGEASDDSLLSATDEDLRVFEAFNNPVEGKLINSLLSLNGFTAARDDLQCGAAHAHAGCNPAGAHPCCDATTSTCVVTLCLNNWCNAATRCSGHDHTVHHMCNKFATATLRHFRHTAPRTCVHGKSRDPMQHAATVELHDGAYDSAALQALHGDDLHEARILLLYKSHKIAKTLEAVKLTPDDDANKPYVIAKLETLQRETGAKRVLLSAATVDEDFMWLEDTSGEAAKLNGLLFKLGTQDSEVDSIIIHPPEAFETKAEEINDQVEITESIMPDFYDSRDVELGLQTLLDPAPLPRPIEREMHCRMTPFKPLPPSKWCCRGKNIRKKVEAIAHPVDITGNWAVYPRAIDGELCSSICRRGHGTEWNGFSFIDHHDKNNWECKCTLPYTDGAPMYDRYHNVVKQVAHPHKWMREQQCEEIHGDAPCENCPVGGVPGQGDRKWWPTCTNDAVEVFRPRDCAAEERFDELRLLRDEVMRPDFFTATSPIFNDPKKFHLERCCKFDVFIQPIVSGNCPKNNPKCHSTFGIPLHFGGDDQNWAIDDLMHMEKSNSYLTQDKASACLIVTQRSDVWLEKGVGPEPNWGAHTETWLRAIPGWDDGRNWVTMDGNDWGAAGGVRDNELLKNGFTSNSDGTGRIVGDSIVAYDRRDWAMVLKSSMSRHHNDPCRHPKKCPADRVKAKSKYHFGYRPSFDVATPLATKHRPVKWAEMLSKKRKYLAFMKGGDDAEARHSLFKLHDPSNGFIVLMHGKVSKAEWDKYDYRTCLMDSRFGLAPAGVGMHSYRMSEVMQYGTIVVDVQTLKDSFVLPYSETLDWTKFSFAFAVEEKERFAKMAQILGAVSETEYRQMQLRSMAVYKTFFERDREASVIFEILKRRIANAVQYEPSRCT